MMKGFNITYNVVDHCKLLQVAVTIVYFGLGVCARLYSEMACLQLGTIYLNLYILASQFGQDISGYFMTKYTGKF